MLIEPVELSLPFPILFSMFAIQSQIDCSSKLIKKADVDGWLKNLGGELNQEKKREK